MSLLLQILLSQNLEVVLFLLLELFRNKNIGFKPILAANPESDEAAFPVDAVVIVSKPLSTAFLITRSDALSLKDAVGFLPSSFI